MTIKRAKDAHNTIGIICLHVDQKERAYPPRSTHLNQGRAPGGGVVRTFVYRVKDGLQRKLSH